jgi:7-carboxy-7-deazaguanine synthase
MRADPSGEPRLKITEVFRSLQGEANAVGFPTTFIRLTGCPLRCSYCDTAYAFHGGEWRTVASLVEQARQHGDRHVCVTGGEPLAQRQCLPLLAQLCDAGFEVSLETSGALPIDEVDARVARVVDLKTPGSAEMARNLESNLAVLRAHDQVKFVICDRADYDWSVAQLRKHGLAERCTVLFSPSAGQLSPTTLADWVLADRLPVRFQLQLHKILWGEQPGR